MADRKPPRTGDPRIRRGSPVALDGSDKVGRVVQAMGDKCRVEWDGGVVWTETRDELRYIGDREDIIRQRYARTGDAKSRS